MRNPQHETVSAPDISAEDGRGRAPERASDPIRRCILLGDRAPRDSLIRLALSPDGAVFPDVRAKAPGRGAWIGVTKAALETAIAKGKLKGALARAFKTGSGKTGPVGIPAALPAMIEAALERAAMDRIGLESRSGALFTGSDKIETAARSGKLHLLLHAADAGEDGNRKLDQAWRIGLDEEGSNRRGLVLPVPRTILAVALGRQNVVHLGLTDPDAAGRVGDALRRWLHFIGPDQTPSPCETASQGASASPHDAGDTLSDPADENYEEPA